MKKCPGCGKQYKNGEEGHRRVAVSMEPGAGMGPLLIVCDGNVPSLLSAMRVYLEKTDPLDWWPLEDVR